MSLGMLDLRASRTSRTFRAARVVLAAAWVPLVGCNAIFGIQPGEGGGTPTSTTGTTTSAGGTGGVGGAGGSGGVGSAGGVGGVGGMAGSGGVMCGPYDGDGTIDWTDLGGANLPPATLQANASVGAQYDSADDVTEISMGSFVENYCSAGARINLSGPPIAGQVYALVDQATRADYALFHQAPNAYVETGARPEPPGDDCTGPEQKVHWFASTAGAGSVKVESLSGVKLAFTATGVVAVPVPGADYDGAGTIGVEITGHADCYWDGM